ncbi:MAG: S8 family serine peptidase, partial [Bacteroidota bacterium]
ALGAAPTIPAPLAEASATPNARLVPIHGLSYSRFLTERMFNHAIASGADVISCSWGTIQQQYRPSSLHFAAIQKAARQGRGGKGCVVLFAAGNEKANVLNFYGTIPEVICVGASTSNDTHAFYSNRGPELSVVAPSDGGWPILAARASWDPGMTGRNDFYVDGRNRGNHYKHFGGTSSATPLVAGICALMLSANPNLTSGQVKQILQNTADKIGSPSEYDTRGHSRKYGFGRVNADRAIAEALRLRGGSSSSTTTTTTGGTGTINIPTTTPTTTPTTRPTTTPTTRPSTGAGITSGEGVFRFSVKAQEKRGFGLQIGVYRDYATVLRETEKLERLFSQPVIVSINKVNNQLAFKVVVGAFPSSTATRDLLGRLKAAGYAPFVRNLADL